LNGRAAHPNVDVQALNYAAARLGLAAGDPKI